MAIDVLAAFEYEPPVLDFIWPGFLAGTVGALVAPGATGKSFWALEAAMSIACSVAGGDLVGLAPAHTGRVVYLAGEDPPPALVRRIHAIGQHLGHTARQAIAENLVLEPIMGKRLDIMKKANLRRVIEDSAGARLIVLDTLSRIHTLDENSNGNMAHLVAVLEHVAANTGASVLYLHHVSKGSAREGQTDQQQAARGASALIDNARWRGYVARMTEDEAKRLSDRAHDRQPIGNDRRGYFVRFGVSKQNYDATPAACWCRWSCMKPAGMRKRDVTVGGEAMAFDLTHARHDPMHCLVPGLFRSLKRGERKKLKLDVTYHYAENEQARFVGFEPLGADDMRLLQGLVALGGPRGIILTPEPTADLPKQLRLFLEPKFDAVGQDALVVRESMTSLLAEIGLTDGGDNIRAIKACLLRMANVTVVVTKGSRQRSFHLMSYAFDEEDGRLFVALNPQIAEAILGRRPYTRIEMAEVRALQTDPARLIHQRLCGWIDPGKAGRVELDTLAGYVWPDEANAEAMKKRRQKARKALAELATVGWKVSEYAAGKWEVGRPKPVVTFPKLRSNVPLHP